MPIKGLNAEIVTDILTLLFGEIDGTPDLYDVLATGFDSSALTANLDGGIIEILNYIISESLGVEFDGSPDAYDVMVTGHATEQTPTFAGSILERMALLLRALISDGAIYTRDSATVNTIVDASLSATDDFYNGYLVIPLSGTYSGQARYVYDYNGTTKTLYVAPDFTGDPDAGGSFNFVLINTGALGYFLDQSGHGLQSIFDIVDAIPDLTRVGGTHDQSDAASTEDTVWTIDAPGGNWSPKSFVIDLSEMEASDVLDVLIYYRIESGGAYVLEADTQYSDAQTIDLIRFNLHENRFGIKITTIQSAGTARDWAWEVYYEG